MRCEQLGNIALISAFKCVSVQRYDLCVISNRDCKQHGVWKRSGQTQLLIVVAMVTTKKIISSRVRTSLVTWEPSLGADLARVSVLLLWRLLPVNKLKEHRRRADVVVTSHSQQQVSHNTSTCVVSHPPHKPLPVLPPPPHPPIFTSDPVLILCPPPNLQ